MREPIANLILAARIPLLAATAAFGVTASASASEKLHYNRDIRPLLSDQCFFCHGPDKNKRDSGLRLDVREEALALHDGIHAIVPGKPDESEIIARITTTDAEDHMPPAKAKLTGFTPGQIATIKRWIAEGAEYEPHWAFVPLNPVAAAESQAESPIDTAVSAALAKRGLKFQPEADRDTLIRRVSFDITGLPPTPEEVAAFEKDTAPDAYERLLNRLLASPRYGERMAVDWLDVARYADSYGFQVLSLIHI